MAFFFAQNPDSLTISEIQKLLGGKEALYAQYPPYSQEWVAQQLLVANLSVQNINIANLIKAIKYTQTSPAMAPATANSVPVEQTPSLNSSETSCSNKIRFSLLQAAKNVNEAIKQILFAQGFTSQPESLVQEQITEKLEQNEAQAYQIQPNRNENRFQENSLLQARKRDLGPYQERNSCLSIQGKRRVQDQEEKKMGHLQYGDHKYFNNQEGPGFTHEPRIRQIPRFAFSRLPAIYQPQRQRKNKSQLAILKRELEENPSKWTKEKIKILADKTGLGKDQVYKWWWDQTSRKKKDH